MHQKINSASFLIAITRATACATFACASAIGATGATGGVNNVPNVPASNAAAIYKMVDANGRVTYTNSPTKGANKVELDPITVIPATPAGVLGDGQRYGQNTAKGAIQDAAQSSPLSAAQNASQAAAATPLAAVAQPAPSPFLIPVGVAPTIAHPEEPSPMPAVAKILPALPALPAAPVARSVAPANVPLAAVAPPVIRSSLPSSPKPIATAVVSAVPANTASTSATKLPVVKLSPVTVTPTNVEVAANIAAPAKMPLVAFAPTAPTFASAPATTLVTTLVTTPAIAATIHRSSINALPVPQLQSSASPTRARSAGQAAKIDQHEQLLATAKAQLVEEQRASESFRALRARLPVVIDQTNPAKAAIQNDIKVQVEQHFERIRNLQDQISRYEQNLAALQPLPSGPASNTAPAKAINTAASQ